MIDLKNILDDISNTNLKPISGTDAGFLYVETPTSPMHIGGLTIVEGELSFDDFKNVIKARLLKLPKFRKRLVQVPFNLDYPYWADDPNFDLDLHIQHIALPQPRDWNTLRTLASSIQSIPLDQSRPLWSITFIEGLDGLSQVKPGSVAIQTKCHHVMIDGVSGMDVMGVLYDREPKKLSAEELIDVPFKPEPLPSDVSVLFKSYSEFIKDPFKLPKVASQTLGNLLKSRMTPRFQSVELPQSSRSAPRTIFNGNVVAKRTWGTAILSFDRIKALKNIMGVTVNDVMLAICAGGIRRYLLEKDKLPKQSLIGMVPISVRKKGENNEINNQISAMLIPLATQIENPIERLEAINDITMTGKSRHKAQGAKTLTKMADAVPFGLANLAAGVYSRYNLMKVHQPVMNVVISNVPGPNFPLYLNGHKILSIMAMAPVIHGMGLIINVLTYNGRATISATSDASTIPDIDVFVRYIREEANLLEKLILEQKEKPQIEKISEVEKAFKKVKAYLEEHTEVTEGKEGMYQFNVEGREMEYWQVNLNKSPSLVKKGNYKDPDAAVNIQSKYLLRILNGELDVQLAFLQGRIKVDGDMEKLMNLLPIFNAMKGE